MAQTVCLLRAASKAAVISSKAISAQNARVNYTKELLEEIGMEKERLRMVNVSAAMARPLADSIIDMVETVRKLGPSPIRNNGSSKKENRL